MDDDTLAKDVGKWSMLGGWSLWLNVNKLSLGITYCNKLYLIVVVILVLSDGSQNQRLWIWAGKCITCNMLAKRVKKIHAPSSNTYYGKSFIRCTLICIIGTPVSSSMGVLQSRIARVQNGRLYLRYRSNSQKNEAKEPQKLYTKSLCILMLNLL